MNKRIALGIVGVILVIGIVLFSIEETSTFLVALGLRIFFFLKHNIIALLTAFFLVKGKFILTLFLKKIAFLSATGLSKRYLIEKVINHNLKMHFLDHIKDDIKRLVVYTKEHFKDFPIIKQIIAGVAFLASLGFVGKFMGGILAMKVFIAKFWSFILAFLLKFSTGIIYFFTDYLWGSWIAPLVEILIFSWVLKLLERVPFLERYVQNLYRFFIEIFEWFEVYMEKIFHMPMKRFFKFIAKRIKNYIYTFIGYKRVPAWKRLKEVRDLQSNAYALLKKKRYERKEKNISKRKLSSYQRLKQNQALKTIERKKVTKIQK